MIVGSGKTATDGIVWLLTNGVQPDRIVWVRPREPWMLDRAVIAAWADEVPSTRRASLLRNAGNQR